MIGGIIILSLLVSCCAMLSYALIAPVFKSKDDE